MKKEYLIPPTPKPRMTRRDRWLTPARSAVARYWMFADLCRIKGMKLPVANAHIIFILEMPASWSKKKKMEFDGKPHQQKPDLDNLVKSVGDALYRDDSKIWDLHATKIWGQEGKIIIEDLEGMISLPLELANNVLEQLYELRGLCNWWKNEPRGNYQRDYRRLCAEIIVLEIILNGLH